MLSSIFRMRLFFPVAASLMGVGLLLVHSGCGILFAPVMVPAAIGSNSNYSLKGTVVDEAGQPLNEVLVHISNQHMYWDPLLGEAMHDESKTVAVNGTFNFPWVRGESVSFSFSKGGYGSRQIDMRENGYEQQSRFGSLWPKDKPARIVLVHAGRVVPWSPRQPVTLLHTKEDGIAVVHLSASNFGGNAPEVDRSAFVPAPTDMYFDIQSQPLKTSGPDHQVDPEDVGLPARMTVRIAGGGFIRTVPVIGSDPFEQMAEAPADGYTPELVFSSQRLKEMRHAGPEYVVQGHEYFFFHFGDRFGKGVLSWSAARENPGFQMTLILVEGDNSRNLATPDTSR